MAVRRIVANVQTDRFEQATVFYRDLLGMTLVMDLGWIITFAGPAQSAPQVSFAREGGTGAPFPDLSVEVDDFDEVYRRALVAGLALEYGPIDEPWGVRRFFVRDPFDRLVNILSHRS